MKTTKTLLHLLVVLAACALGPGSAQTVLLNDSFSDGQRDNQSLPNSAAWYLVNDNAVQPTATVNADHELAWADKAGTYSGLIAFFTPAAQTQSLGIDDSLKLEFRIALDNLSSANRVIRVGLMNSGGKRLSADALNTGATGLAVGTTFNNWRGYAMLTAADAGPVAGLFYIVERTGVNSALFSSGAYTQLGAASDSATLTESEFQQMELTITRRAAQMEITGRVGDTTLGPIADTSGTVTSFDTVALFVQPEISGLRIDDVKVTYLPKPSAADDPNLVVLTESVFGRLPVDAPSPSARVSIKNGGASQILTVQAQSAIGGPDASQYRIITPLPLNIALGATGVIEVAFDPQARFGDFAATLQLHSNDPSEPILPVTLDARYFHSGDQLLANPGFELDDNLSGWAQAGTITAVGGLSAGSNRAALLNQGSRLGQENLIVPGDFQIEFLLAVPDSSDEAFELLLKTFPGFDRGNVFFDLRYSAGQFNVLSGADWGDDIGLGRLQPSADANSDGDLKDPEDTRALYRFRLTAHGWGGDNPTYDLALSEKNSDVLSREVKGLARFVGGGGGGAAPPAILIFSAENNPGYWLDDVRLIAGLPKVPSFRITTVSRDRNLGRVTLSWEGEANATYDIESAATLGSAWSTVITGLAGQASAVSFTDTNAAGSSRFYRVIRH